MIASEYQNRPENAMIRFFAPSAFGRRHLTALIVLATTGFGVTACRRTPKPALAKDGSIAIGIGASSGKPGYEGVMRGVQLAVELLNAESGGSVKFSIRTPAVGAASAVQIAQGLRDDPSVIAVVGHPESGTSLEAIPIYADAEHSGENAVAAISPTASSPRLSGASPWFFRVAPSDNEAARLVAQYVSDSLHATTAAVVYRNDSYGRDWSAKFSEAFTDRKGAVVAKIPYLTGITEWNAYALQLGKLAPQVLLFPGDADDATQMLRALKTAGVKLTFIGGDGTTAIATTHEFPDAKYAAFFLADRVTEPVAKRFVELFRTRFKEEPDMFSALSYDATLAIGSAVMKGARTRKGVREGLEKITVTSPVAGAGGKIAFNTQHDVVGRSVVIATVGAGSKP
jgi:branched-chain amino acid transport system substrate-binding protein